MSQLLPLVQDYETFFGTVKGDDGKNLSLSLRNKDLAMSEYIRHPEFQVHGVSLQLPEMDHPEFFKAHEIPGAYRDIDWKAHRVVAHNALFEGLINFEKFGVVPGAYFCTMALAEAVYQGAFANGLEDVATALGLGEKLPDLPQFKDVRTEDITPEMWEVLGSYANNDVELTKKIFDLLAPTLPPDEWELMNRTLMLFANPKLRVDVLLATEALEDSRKERKTLVEATGLTEKEISGNNSFAEHLRKKLGHIPTKISPTTGKTVPAFAKTDREFVALKSHEDETVRALVNARLEVKSNQSITRPARIITAGTTGTKLLPVCLHYSRAHTMRWSGGNKMNLQNLQRGGKLRRSIVAPPGYVIVVVDSSQIECRSNGAVAGQLDLVQQFRDGLDPYSIMASKVYGFEVIKSEHPDERFVGKTMTLALGYGMGWWKFWNEMITGSRGKAMPITQGFAQRAVQTYRSSNNMIVGLWRTAEQWMAHMCFGKEPKEFMDGLFTIDPKNNKVIFANGCYLRYPQFKCEEGEYMYYQVKGKSAKWTKIWGGHFVENFIQSLARHIVAAQILIITNHWPAALFVHDECAYLVPEDEAEDALAFGIKTFKTLPPAFSSLDLPLGAEGGYDYCYSK